MLYCTQARESEHSSHYSTADTFHSSKLVVRKCRHGVELVESGPFHPVGPTPNSQPQPAYKTAFIIVIRSNTTFDSTGFNILGGVLYFIGMEYCWSYSPMPGRSPCFHQVPFKIDNRDSHDITFGTALPLRTQRYPDAAMPFVTVIAPISPLALRRAACDLR